MLIKSILKDAKTYIMLKSFQEKWIRERGNNFTRAGNVFPCTCVDIGDYTYGTLNVYYYNQPEEHLSIGRYCSIANDVKFILGGGHDSSHLTTYPFKNRVMQNKIQEATTKGPIMIEDDVWIGQSCIILSGVTIGKGAIIGAGSVVAKNVPPYAIYCGLEVKKFRFNQEMIQILKDFDLSKIDYENSSKIFDSLYTKLTSDNINDILKKVTEK